MNFSPHVYRHTAKADEDTRAEKVPLTPPGTKCEAPEPSGAGSADAGSLPPPEEVTKANSNFAASEKGWESSSPACTYSYWGETPPCATTKWKHRVGRSSSGRLQVKACGQAWERGKSCSQAGWGQRPQEASPSSDTWPESPVRHKSTAGRSLLALISSS